MSTALTVPGEADPRRAAPPFSEEVDTRLIEHTYGWDGYIHRPDLARVGICCSGGGIRSASYCLGALQVLRTSRYLDDAEYLAAVSGGGYISLAHTVLVSETLREAEATGVDQAKAERQYFGGLAPWALSSPEEEHLRDRSNYLAPGPAGKVWFAVNLIYGMIRHLIPFTVLIFLASAGFAVAYGRALQTPLHASGPPLWNLPSGLLTPLLFVLAGLAAVAGAALLLRQREQARRNPDGARMEHLRRIVTAMLGLQLVVALFGLGLPALLVWIHHRPFGGLFNSGAKAAGFEGGSISILSLAAYLTKRGTSAKRPSAKFLVPLVTTLLAPLVVGVPFIALTYWMAQRLDRFWLLPAILSATALGLLIVYSFIDESTPNMHLFYRERLASAFVGRRRFLREKDGDDYQYFEEPKWSEPVWFSGIHNGEGPARLPKLVVCAAVNVSQDVPPGRLAASFTFEQDYSGGPLTGYLPTHKLEGLAGKSVLTLPAMMAVSGAALSPSMGKMTRPWLRLLLAMFNARLGVWLPNPLCNDPLRAHQLEGKPASVPDESEEAGGQPRFHRLRRRLRSPGTLYALREALGQNDVRRPFVYVTDGGHWDNLGLVELLRRGCCQILCFDAAGDDLKHFSTLSQAIALARSELGVRIEIDLKQLIPGDDGYSPSDVVTGCIRYPDGQVGVLVLAKLALAESAPLDAKSYHDRDPKFPTNPISDQLFNDQKFESYHALGRHAAMGAVRAMNAWRRAKMKPQPPAPPAAPTGRGSQPPATEPQDAKPQVDPCAQIEPIVDNPFHRSMAKPPEGQAP